MGSRVVERRGVYEEEVRESMDFEGRNCGIDEGV